MAQTTQDNPELDVGTLVDKLFGATPDIVNREGKPPIPSLVYVINDCRSDDEMGPAGNLTDSYGIFLGEFFIPDDYHPLRTDMSTLKRDDSKDIHANPLILTEKGDYIFGIECYWVPADGTESDPKVKQALMDGVVAYVKKVGPSVLNTLLGYMAKEQPKPSKN